MPADPQQPLPFDEAEGTNAERRALIGLALKCVEADLHLRELMIWIFNVTRGGSAGTFKKPLREIAGRPWGLCCSVDKARATLREAVRLGWLEEEQTYKADGGDAEKAYTLVWEGIRAALDLSRRPGARAAAARRSDSCSNPAPTATSEPLRDTPSPPSLAATPRLPIATPALPAASAYKESPSLYPLSLSSSSPTPPARRRDETRSRRSSLVIEIVPPIWEEAAAELKALGVRSANVLEKAGARGLTPSDVLQAAKIYRANEAKFRADTNGERVGALIWFLQNGAWPNGIRVDDPDELERRRVEREAAKARELEEAARIEAEEAQADADVESRFGSVLNAMHPDRHLELLGPKCPFLESYRKGDWYRKGDAVRLFLLHKLADREAAECR